MSMNEDNFEETMKAMILRARMSNLPHKSIINQLAMVQNIDTIDPKNYVKKTKFYEDHDTDHLTGGSNEIE